MAIDWQAAGVQAAKNAHKTRAGSIRAYYAAIDRTRQDGFDFGIGVLWGALEIVGAWLKAGGVPQSGNHAIDSACDEYQLALGFQSTLASRDDAVIVPVAVWLVDKADELIAAGSVTFSSTQQPPAPPPAIHVHNAVSVAPSSIGEVAIVKMPARETSTAVTRDGNGNIRSTTQTERDAAGW